MSGRRVNWKAIFTQLFLLVLIVLLMVRVYFYRPVVVTQRSMEPNLFEEDRLLVNIRALEHRLPERGAIVVLEHPTQGHWVVKRVIGLPGDRLQILPSGVEIDGRRLREPYARPFADLAQSQIVVPADAVYVLGDNRPQSEDSRDFGPVDRSKLIGQVTAVLGPRERRRRIEPEPPSW